jgi:hypothetical protein
MTRDALTLDPVLYTPHRLHTQQRNWAETNCYVDIWIELLHAWGFEPIAALPFTITIDFEADQWTFFKFPHADLHHLFGVEVQELAIWRPLELHVEEQLALDRPVLVELDSFYLPDTAGTAYRQSHVKTTVAAMEIDIAEQRLGYFHGQGFYQLTGDDFVHVFRMTGGESPAMLPPYAEFVKRRAGAVPDGKRLVEESVGLLRRYLKRLPQENPFHKFKLRIAADLQWLRDVPLGVFHQYAFATLRQFGSCYECTANYLQWLSDHDVAGLHEAIAGFTALSTGAKTMQFQLARALARNKGLNLASLDDMAAAWQTATDCLASRIGSADLFSCPGNGER